MKILAEKTVQIHVKFSDRSLAGLALEELRRDGAVLVNILRGRVTKEEASFDLEVSGTARRVEHFLRRSGSWGSSLGAAPAGVALGKSCALVCP